MQCNHSNTSDVIAYILTTFTVMSTITAVNQNKCGSTLLYYHSYYNFQFRIKFPIFVYHSSGIHRERFYKIKHVLFISIRIFLIAFFSRLFRILFNIPWNLY